MNARSPFTASLPSPVGPLLARTDGRALGALMFADEKLAAGGTLAQAARTQGQQRILDALGQWLDAYFHGIDTPIRFPLEPAGTPFQQQVWAALQRIPFGTTASYAAIARSIGQPTAVRAVGAANGRNPIAILIPCHRVIGSNGTLTGYAGGLERKRDLLALEQGQFELVATSTGA